MVSTKAQAPYTCQLSQLQLLCQTSLPILVALTLAHYCLFNNTAAGRQVLHPSILPRHYDE